MEFPGQTQKALQDLIPTHLCTPAPVPLRCWVLLSTAPRFRLLALCCVVPAPSPPCHFLPRAARGCPSVFHDLGHASESAPCLSHAPQFPLMFVSVPRLPQCWARGLHAVSWTPGARDFKRELFTSYFVGYPT